MNVNAYLVPEWVRVRQEDFGLLFYDTRSTRLTFVRSGDRLVPPPFTGARRELGVVAAEPADAIQVHTLPTEAGAADAPLSHLLEDLVGKGLLVAAQAE